MSDLFKKYSSLLCAGSDNIIVYPIDKECPAAVSGLEQIRRVNLGVAVCSACHHQFISPVLQGVFLAFLCGVYVTGKNRFFPARYADSISTLFREHYSA